MKGALLDGFVRSDGKDGVGHRRCSRKGSGESTALTRLGPLLNATDPNKAATRPNFLASGFRKAAPARQKRTRSSAIKVNRRVGG